MQGATTITEQYIKNAYIGNERTITRKIREAVLAWQLEDRWSKDRILTAYLNTVFYGPRAYGVQAAAQTYFHRERGPALAQAGGAAGRHPQRAHRVRPRGRPEGAKQRRNLVLQAMAQQGYITQAKAQTTMRQKLGVYQSAPASANPLADYFLSYVEKVLTKRYGTAEVFSGGLKVYTSIDMAWQREAYDIVKNTTAPLNFGFKPAAALVAIEPQTGYIRTMVGGLDYKTQNFNLATQARRQAVRP